MAQQISTRYTRFVWYGPTTAVTSLPNSVLSRINFLRAINSTGSGFTSYKFGRGTNSLTSLANGAILELDALGITAGNTTTYFSIDNGTAPAGGGGGSDTIQLSGPGGVTVSEFEESFTATSAAVPSVAFTSGTGTVQYSTNAGASWAALPSSIPAGTAFMLRVQHTAAFSATLTLTY